MVKRIIRLISEEDPGSRGICFAATSRSAAYAFSCEYRYRVDSLIPDKIRPRFLDRILVGTFSDICRCLVVDQRLYFPGSDYFYPVVLDDAEQLNYLADGIGWFLVERSAASRFGNGRGREACARINACFGSSNDARYEAVGRLAGFFNALSLGLEPPGVLGEAERRALSGMYEDYKAGLMKSDWPVLDEYLLQGFVADLISASSVKNEIFRHAFKDNESSLSPTQSRLFSNLASCYHPETE